MSSFRLKILGRKKASELERSLSSYMLMIMRTPLRVGGWPNRPKHLSDSVEAVVELDQYAFQTEELCPMDMT